MLPLANSREARREIRGVFCDIDDTLTTGGRLTAAAYAAMERLQQAGLMVVPITGRPAGWCDHIARMWPVVGGGRRERRVLLPLRRTPRRTMQRRFVDDAATRAAHRAAPRRDRRRKSCRRCPARRSPPTSTTARPISPSTTARTCRACRATAVDRIVAIMESHGLTAKVSSIHVNGWFGDLRQAHHDADCSCAKRSTSISTCARGATCSSAIRPTTRRCSRYFPHAVGVANIREFAGRLAHEPRYVTHSRERRGILRARRFLLARDALKP